MVNILPVLLSLLALICLPSIESQSCSRVLFEKNVLVVLLDGVRADVVQNNFEVLPNFESLSTHGLSAECLSWEDSSCAKTSLGARYSTFPLPPDQLGPQNRSSTEIGPYLDLMYHWFGFNGFASVISGLDTNKLEMRGEDSLSANRFFQLMRNRDGTFLKQAYDAGNIVAATGGVPFLTSDYLNDYKTNTYGVLDFECGVRIDGSPNVLPTASSSCNTHFRYSVPFNLYNVLGDTPAVNYALNILNNGCANVVTVHLKDPDTAMHAFGLSSPQYLDALVSTDSRLGSLLAAVETHSNTYSADWLVILTANHGGADTADAPYVFNINTGSMQRMDHDMNWGPDEAVPFIVKHYSSPNGHVSITNFTGTPHHFDVTPTVLSYFGIESSDVYDGVVQGISIREESNTERIFQSFVKLLGLFF